MALCSVGFRMDLCGVQSCRVRSILGIFLAQFCYQRPAEYLQVRTTSEGFAVITVVLCNQFYLPLYIFIVSIKHNKCFIAVIFLQHCIYVFASRQQDQPA